MNFETEHLENNESESKFKEGDMVQFKNFDEVLNSLKNQLREANDEIDYINIEKSIQLLRLMGSGPLRVKAVEGTNIWLPSVGEYAHRWNEDLFELVK